MTTATDYSTSADFLTRVFDSADAPMSSETAQYLLSLKFPEGERKRVDDLSAKAGLGTLTDVEERELNDILRCGRLLQLLQLKARVALKTAPAT